MQGNLFAHHGVNIVEDSLTVCGSWKARERGEEVAATAISTDLLGRTADMLSEISHPMLVDVGAGTGAFSMLAEVVENLSVYAIEPAEHAYSLLRQNIQLNTLSAVRARTFRCALSHRDAPLVLHVPPEEERSGLATVGHLHRMNGAIQQTVDGIKLDSFFKQQAVPRVDVIKIHVEGFTPSVLAGARHVLKEFNPTLLLDVHSTKLEQCGFRPDQVFILLKQFDYDYQELGDGEYLATPRFSTKCLTILGKQYRSINQKIFDQVPSQIINIARLKHLESLELPLKGRDVLEVGGGVGRLSGFFEERGARLFSTEAREDNLLEHRRRFPFRKIAHLDLNESNSVEALSPSDVVFCYGTLYHLSQPELALRRLAKVCRGLFLLETMVYPKDEGNMELMAENRDISDQAFDGIGCRPSRTWIFDLLKELYPYVYIPLSQPFHEYFPLDFPANTQGCPLARATFIASQHPIDRPGLLSHLPSRYSYVPHLENGFRNGLKADFPKPYLPYSSSTILQNTEALCWLCGTHQVHTIFCPIGCDLPALLGFLRSESRPTVILCQSSLPSGALEVFTPEERTRVRFLGMTLDKLWKVRAELPLNFLLYIPDRDPLDNFTLDFLLRHIVRRFQPEYVVIGQVFMPWPDPSRGNAMITAHFQTILGSLFHEADKFQFHWQIWNDRVIVAAKHELDVVVELFNTEYMPLFRPDNTFVFLCRTVPAAAS